MGHVVRELGEHLLAEVAEVGGGVAQSLVGVGLHVLAGNVLDEDAAVAEVAAAHPAVLAVPDLRLSLIFRWSAATTTIIPLGLPLPPLGREPTRDRSPVYPAIGWRAGAAVGECRRAMLPVFGSNSSGL